MATLEASHNSFGGLMPSALPGHNMSIKEMYDLVNKQDASWGISGYKVPKEYLDSKQLKEIREGNPKRPAPRATKIGDYLTETTKVTKNLPAPNQYNIVKPWVDETKKPKAPKVASRTTYLESISIEAKRRPLPGPGAYDVLKAPKPRATTKPKGGERGNFLNDYEYLSNSMPGPGNYNPRPLQPKLRENRLKPEDWKKKHTEQGKVKKGNFPEVGTYTPLPTTFETFDKIMEKQKNNKGGAQKKNWGSEERFASPDKKKNKKADGPPGPGQYNMICNWNMSPKAMKDDKKEGTHVFEKISKGISKSIYYS